MKPELVVSYDGRAVARIRRDARGRLSLVYDASWREAANSFPLSLSMPLAQLEHGHRTVEAYLWGLLPDNELIIERWAKRHQVSPRNPFALAACVGEDCAGAVQLIPSDRPSTPRRGAVEWLDEEQVSLRLRALRHDISAWRAGGDLGQFSLAGAHAKTALYFDGNRWGLPSGAAPTTHILKPGAVDLAGHVHDEYFCMALASELGLPVARSWVARFEDEVAIVVERYDRVRVGSQVRRVHQEDVCQSLAVHPARKYESEGGPGARTIVELLRDHSGAPNEDVATFVSALLYNWLVAGTDAHAKNYSLLIGGGGRARLTPLYDLASALPYAKHRERKLKLAMKVGGSYRLHDIGRYHWSKLAAEIGLSEDDVLGRAIELALAIPDLAVSLAKRIRDVELDHGVVDELAALLSKRARTCAKALR
jgi:serine/threonine-protein kinase HipA